MVKVRLGGNRWTAPVGRPHHLMSCTFSHALSTPAYGDSLLLVGCTTWHAVGTPHSHQGSGRAASGGSSQLQTDICPEQPHHHILVCAQTPKTAQIGFCAATAAAAIWYSFERHTHYGRDLRTLCTCQPGEVVCQGYMEQRSRPSQESVLLIFRGKVSMCPIPFQLIGVQAQPACFAVTL